MDRGGVVYLMASHRHGTLYVGVTSDLLVRVMQHRVGSYGGFTSQYGVNRLVWYEQHGSIETAIAREKAIKKWNRSWKVALIERENGNWVDMAEVLFGLPRLSAVVERVDNSERR